MRHRKIVVDLSTEDKRHEVFNKLDSFTSKNQAYDFFGISDNKNGIAYLKEIAETVGFDLNIYKERRKKPEYFCLQCGKKIEGKGTKFCSCSCSVTYNNLHRDKSVYDKVSVSLSNLYPEDHRSERDPITNRSKNNSNKRKNNKNIESTCIHCGKIFIKKYSQQKSCTTCAKLYKYTTYPKICKNCGKSFKGSSPKSKFCCSKCSSEYIHKISLAKFLNGEYANSNPYKIPCCIKSYLLEIHHNKCQLCGFEGYNRKTGNSILQLHHIDGNSGNNTPENIQLLCPNCHAMTENYMSLNKGNATRHWHKKYIDKEA